MAEIATSTGNRVGSMADKSMTTDVSISPRGGRVSATGRGILINHRVHILAKAPARDARGSDEGSVDSVRWDEDARTKGVQLPNRDTIPGDNECASLIQFTHDSSALVA